MSGGGGQTTSTQTSNSSPWVGAQPYLSDVLYGAGQEYHNGNDFMPYPNSTVVPFSSQTTQALQGIQNQATSGNPLGQASFNSTLGMLNNGGLTPYQSQAGAGLAGLAGGGQNPSAVGNYLQNYANGSNVNGGSPEFKQALDFQSGNLTNDINRSFSNSGRFGSMANANEVVDRVGQMRNSAMANEIAREQGQQIQSAGMLSGEQQQGFGDRLSSYGNLGGIGAQGSNQLAQFTGLSPSVYGQQYAPYQQLAGVGSQYEDLSTRTLQDQINRYYQTNQAPWTALSTYNGLINGMGGMGGTTTQTAQQPRNYGAPLGGALGGAQLGSAFGPWGAGIGAVGGGLLGLLGM